MQEWETLYRNHHKAVYRYLCSLTHDASLAEDLLSETFIKAMKKLNTYDGTASIQTWLCVIARNTWLDLLRKKRMNISYDEIIERYLELPHTSDSLAENYETAELLEKVKQLLEQRKKPAQEVVWMRAQGYTFAEIAKAVGISESSARTLDFRTKHWLKEQLGFL